MNKKLFCCLIIGFISLLMTAKAKAEENSIGLQNPETRAVVYCYKGKKTSIDECVQYFEKQGFIKIRNIPYKTANYDFLTVDNFPTRRWRSGELTPRW